MIRSITMVNIAAILRYLNVIVDKTNYSFIGTSRTYNIDMESHQITTHCKLFHTLNRVQQFLRLNLDVYGILIRHSL